jgi:hypothetical protein
VAFFHGVIDLVVLQAQHSKGVIYIYKKRKELRMPMRSFVPHRDTYFASRCLLPENAMKHAGRREFHDIAYFHCAPKAGNYMQTVDRKS